VLATVSPRKLESEYLSLREAAALFSASRDTMRRLISRGELSATRLPGSRLIRVRRAELNELFESNIVPTKDPA
jgi:excisionase family DNA binding protein